MKQSELTHKFLVGDRVKVPGAHISGNGSRQHHYQWVVGVIEALGWSKPTLKDIETGEMVEETTGAGLVIRRQVRETRMVKLPLYRVNGRWTGNVRKP